MSWWDRYQPWRLGSRAHYVPTTVGLRALVVFLASWLYYGSSAGKALLLTATFAVLGTLVFWFWYPRAKARASTRRSPRGRLTFERGSGRPNVPG